MFILHIYFFTPFSNDLKFLKYENKYNYIGHRPPCFPRYRISCQKTNVSRPLVTSVISLKFCTKSFENVHLTYENSTIPLLNDVH